MLKSVAPGAMAVCGIAFGIGVLVTDRSASIATVEAAATGARYASQPTYVSTADPNDNLYRQCLTEVVARQEAANRADIQRFLEETEGACLEVRSVCSCR